MSMRKYSASAVANFFIERGIADGVPVTMLKLMKLTYIAHGWHLAMVGRELLDEEVQAWKYGPVIPSLYHSLKSHGRCDILEPINEFSLETFDFEEPMIPENDKITGSILQKVWSVYKDLSGGALVNRTHDRDTPWEKYFDPSDRYTVIPTNVIKDYYIALLTKFASDED